MLHKIGEVLSPDQAMAMALEVGKEGRGLVSPNPLVGCVIVDKEHRLIGAGAHLKFGSAHAEMNALSNVQSKDALQGATVYVTLEPCAHEGNTGSCAKALGKLPIAKVVYGCLDPNPLVAGQGLKILQQNSIHVELFTKYEKERQRLAEQFLFHIKKQRPFVAIKVATSLDGKMALNNGESQWITGEKARQYSRELRAHYDATLIGSGTFLYDNPKLDFRNTAFEGKKDNKIVLVDPKGKGAEFYKKSQLAQIHSPKNFFVLTRPDHVDEWSKQLVHVIPWEADAGSWRQSLKNLYQKGIHSIYCEGGSYIFGQLLQNQMAQKLYHFQAPVIVGDGVSWTQAFEVDSLDKAIRVSRMDSQIIGSDQLDVYYF